MKTKTVVLVFGVLAFVGSYLLFAQDSSPKMMQNGMQMCPMCGMMASGMMQKTLVALDDGIVVMVGNRLTKYDKDLKKVAEAELTMDMADMHQKMQQMMQNCPMMQGANGTASESPMTAPEDHQKHHLAPSE